MAKILIVDDEETSSVILSHYLEISGHHMSRAATADEATVYLQGRERIDVMILDYMMPGRSGLDLLQAMGRDASLQRPAVIISSALLQGAWWMPLRSLLPQAIQDIVLAFVDKPFTVQQMESTLNQILSRPKAPGEPPSGTSINARIKILMAEDDEVSAPLVLHELRAFGYGAAWCRYGAACWEAISHADLPIIDILLLDLGLPDIRGEEILRRIGISSSAQRTRVIIVTGDLALGEEKAFLQKLPVIAQEQVSSILIKPFDMGDLRGAIDKAVKEISQLR